MIKTESYRRRCGSDAIGRRKEFLFEWDWHPSFPLCSYAQVGEFVLEASGPSGERTYCSVVRYSGNDSHYLRTNRGYDTRVKAQQGAERMLEIILRKHTKLLNAAKACRNLGKK